jgi:hypothetical protein
MQKYFQSNREKKNNNNICCNGISMVPTVKHIFIKHWREERDVERRKSQQKREWSRINNHCWNKKHCNDLKMADSCNCGPWSVTAKFHNLNYSNEFKMLTHGNKVDTYLFQNFQFPDFIQNKRIAKIEKVPLDLKVLFKILAHWQKSKTVKINCFN